MRSTAPLRAAVAAGLLSMSLATAVAASPDPANNQNAAWMQLDCTNGPATVATIVQNNAGSLNVVDGDGVTLHMVELWSWTDPAHTMDGTLWFSIPGVAHNGHATVSCSYVNPRFPGLYWVSVLTVSPAASAKAD